MAGKYLLTTLGCKVNQYESQQIRELLESFGLRPARRGDVPDIAVVNTCAVTVNASRKSRQVIRRAARGGRTPVLVVGCGATADPKRLRELEGVTTVLGHDMDVCGELRGLLARFDAGLSTIAGEARHVVETTHKSPHAVGDKGWMMPSALQQQRQAVTSRTTTSPLHIMPPCFEVVKTSALLVARIESFAGHQRAFLKVQDGCDAFCTYCIIPRLRPRLRSKPVEVAVAEARDLVCAGHKEIIVTGIFLGAYGRETAQRKRFGRQRSPLTTLVEALAKVQGLERLRLSSLEPGDVDSSLLDALATHEACVPHLHLSLQSGSAEILRRMNRQYTRDEFTEMIERVQAALDRPAISTDIIVGFPSETDEDFEASLDIARRAQFVKIHAFPFSPRENTPAARRQSDFVHPRVVRERMQRLAEVERECSLGYRRRFVGEVERVIVEESGRTNGVAYLRRDVRHGRADRYFEIHFETGGSPGGSHQTGDIRPGDLVSVRIDRVTPTRTHGTHIRADTEARPLSVP